MTPDEAEDQALREVALLNAREILAARQRAEQELRDTRDELKAKTQELAYSLELVRATLESTADGLLVTDSNGKITDFNQQYVAMWRLPNELMSKRDHRAVLDHVSAQFADATAARRRIEAIYAAAPPESWDTLELTDGRVYERFSKIQLIDGCNVGRVWSFRDITQRVRNENARREETRALEVLNRTGTALASRLDIKFILQTVTDAATELTRAQFGAFFSNMHTSQGDSYTLYTLSGASREALEKFPLSRATRLFGATFKGEGIIRSDDVLADPRYEHSLSDSDIPVENFLLRSYLAVPVMSREGLVHGGLFFGHAATHQFTERHEHMISSIAAHAAIAIDNARLFESNQRALADLETSNATLEQRVAERTAALIESERQFKILVAGVTDYGIYMLNPQGHIVSWNPGAERIKGYSEAEIIGQHFSRFYTDEDRANRIPDNALAIAASTGKYEAEAWRVRKDGTLFWASAVIDAIRDDNGELIGFAKITRDMTERRAIQEQLNQSQKMEAIGQLTGGVAHDFNNLLTIILGNLETLTRHLPKEEGRLQLAAQYATRGAQRAATLTQQLLAFSRSQPLNPKPTDINRLVTEVSALMRHTLGESIDIETVLSGGLWRTEIDRHQLESALLNLAVNSRDAMPNGGKITIETANAHLDENYAVNFAEISAGQYVVICVSDTGCGMSADVMAKAFSPFFTTKPIGEGTGLGLSQVYGYVKQSGGHIKLYSEIGQGTVVRIYLPRLVGGQDEQEIDIPAMEPHGRLDETILVVEDDSDVRAYSTDCLRELGFTVIEAAEAESALRLLRQHPEVQLVFTDVGLPGLNGRELVEKIRELRPTMRVLFTTGYARNAIVHHGRLDPGVELLTKPFTRSQLAEWVRKILDAKPTNEAVALVVEDIPMVRMYVAEILSDFGFKVIEAESAGAALDAAKSQTAIDLAVVDIGLPDRSGIDLVLELRRDWPQMSVVITSGYGNPLTSPLKDDQQVTFIGKPYKQEDLRGALDRLGMSLPSSSAS